ncbi:MAG: glycosyltransferase family 2 protein [Patescibacteria group bacterium]|jgi:hypothetical protein
MDLSIIIVSWNVAEKLRENLAALFKSRADFSFEVFVVDNNSSDGSAEMVKSEFPRADLIANSHNAGFAKANNQALREAKGNYVLLLNPDMKVFPDTLAKMLKWMKENPKAAVAGCRLVGKKGNTVKHVRRFPKLSDQLAIVLKLPHIFKNILREYLREDFDYTRAARVDSIRGGFFMINREAAEKLGRRTAEGIEKESANPTLPFLDERYFLWFEEVDYCQQIKAAGGEVWFAPAAECVDYVGQSFKLLRRGAAQGYFRDSMLKYFKKWRPVWQYWILKIVWPAGQLLTAIGEFLNIKTGGKT